MSCWVVPTVAAEIWGVSVDHVLDQIRQGNVPSKQEDGFVFVDVAPDSRRVSSSSTPQERPQTFTVVSRAEMRALQGDETVEQDESADEDEFTAVDSDDPLPEQPAWRDVRRNVGTQRRAPASGRS